MPEGSLASSTQNARWLLETPWTHGLSDALTAVACSLILAIILCFLWRRRDAHLLAIGSLLCAFVLVVGVTHAVDAMSLDNGHYALRGALKVVTAVVSALTAYTVWRLVPATLAIARGGEIQRQVQDATAGLKQQNDDLNDAAADSDAFVSATSHDLKEPLRTLLAFGALLEQDMPGQLSDNARSDLAHIRSAANRMQQLVGDLLELSTTTSGPLRLANVSLDECLAQALCVLDEQIRDSTARIDQSPLPSLVTDCRLMTQILQNLVSNAIKFSEPGQPPIVKISVTSGSDGTLTIGVADAGIGIPEDARSLIFEPFERLHAREQFEGTGLGLAICKRAIRRLGGRIWVEDSAHGGAHFKFTIPPGDSDLASSMVPERQRRTNETCLQFWYPE
jgi:signal transduction histidine kinase